RRGWSTFSKARPVLIAERRKWSAGRRVPPIATRNGTLARRPMGVFRKPPTGGLASPSACRRSAPLDGSRELQLATRACPGPTKEHGRRRAPPRHSGARAESAFTRVFEEHARTRNPDTRTDERSEP